MFLCRSLLNLFSSQTHWSAHSVYKDRADPKDQRAHPSKCFLYNCRQRKELLVRRKAKERTSHFYRRDRTGILRWRAWALTWEGKGCCWCRAGGSGFLRSRSIQAERSSLLLSDGHRSQQCRVIIPGGFTIALLSYWKACLKFMKGQRSEIILVLKAQSK